jgi:1,2-dihydroxy-3-keto-5-methylthiopentene dioxygenase
MRAHWMEPSEHACPIETLRGEGIGAEPFDPRSAEELTWRLKTQRGWQGEERVQLSQTVRVRTLEAMVAKEADEHAHTADEVRFIVQGEAVYDVRARDERWIRIWVSAGDLVTIPAKRYHRFLLGQQAGIEYVHIFEDRAALLSLFRQSQDDTRAV